MNFYFESNCYWFKILNVPIETHSPIRNGTLNVHKKQDKSKIHKYSPFQLKEKDIQKKKRRKTFAKKTGGSNSFLSTATQQKAKMAIKKGNRKSSKKPKKESFGALELVSRASEKFRKVDSESKADRFSNSFEKISSKESREASLAHLTQSPRLTLTQTQEEGGNLSKIDEKISQESMGSRERFDSPKRKEGEKVLVLNTPTKSEMQVDKDKANDFEFDF